MLKIDQKAPSFSLPDQHNTLHSLANNTGKYLILYFYPKDNTPGCTREGIEFSERKDDFAQLNTTLYGISKDSVASHLKFCTQQNLSISLLSDENGTMVHDYGVWQEKKNYGKTYMGIVRTTFLIDPKGIIRHIWNNVRVAGHVDDVYTTLHGIYNG